MINATSAFKTAIANDNRKYLRYADITLSNGTVLNLTNQHFYQGGMKFTDATSDDNNFEVGAFMVGSLTLTLNNTYGTFTNYIFEDAKVVAYVGLQLSNGLEKLRKGTYVVSEARGQNSSVVTLTCLDNGHKFNRPYSQCSLVYPASLGRIVETACTACNVTAVSTQFSNHDFVISKRPEGDSLTCGNIVSAAAQIACKFVRMNVNGNLYLGWYSNTVANRHSISSLSSHDIAMDDVVITGVKVIVSGSEDEAITVLEGTNDYVVEVENNPLITADNAQDIAEMMGNILIGMTFRPLSVSALSDPTIEAGDYARITDRKGNAYDTFINNVSWTVGDYETFSCEAETPARNAAKRLSEAARSYARLRDELEAQKTAFDIAYEDLVDRINNSSGFYETDVTQVDGSAIRYQHNKPTLADSDIIWMETAETRSVSTDGGLTWNAGLTADGNAILQKLSVHGINADWINAGLVDAQYIDAKGLTVYKENPQGNPIKTFEVDENGNVSIVANSFSLTDGTTLASAASDAASNAVSDYDSSWSQSKVFNLLTVNGTKQGIWMDNNGDLYINMSYLSTGALQVKNGNNVETLYVNSSTGEVRVNASSFSLTNGTTLSSIYDDAVDYANSILNLASGNLLKSSLDFSDTYWFHEGTLTTGQSDPQGGTNAVMLTVTTGEGYLTAIKSTNNPFKNTGLTYRLSIWMKTSNTSTARTNAANNPLTIRLNNNSTTVVLTSKWTEYIFDVTVSSVASSDLVTVGGRTTYTASSGYPVYIYNPTVTLVTDTTFSQTAIFNAITGNGANNGVFMLSNGQIYINATYINTGIFCGWTINNSAQTLTSPNGNIVIDAGNARITCSSLGNNSAGNPYNFNSLFSYQKVQAPVMRTDDFMSTKIDVGGTGGSTSYNQNFNHLIVGSAWTNSSGNDYRDEFLMHELFVDGGGVYCGLSPSTGTPLVGILQGGSGFTSGRYRFATQSSSSKRYKNHIRDVEIDDVSQLYNLPVVWFKYKNGYLIETDENVDKEIPGFYAEDIEDIYPQGVYHSNGCVENWRERTMIPAMMKLIQDLNNRVTQLEEEVALLKQNRSMEV